MKTKLRVDTAGRIVLPQPLRRQFHLDPGSVLHLEVSEGAIILRPQHDEPALVEEEGLLVHEGDPSGDLLNAVDAARRRRDHDVGRSSR